MARKKRTSCSTENTMIARDRSQIEEISIIDKIVRLRKTDLILPILKSIGIGSEMTDQKRFYSRKEKTSMFHAEGPQVMETSPLRPKAIERCTSEKREGIGKDKKIFQLQRENYTDPRGGRTK